MIIQPIQEEAPPQTSPYDSIWAQHDVPVQERGDLERLMLAQDKLYVVLAVVLIIWLGLTYFLFRTDRKIARLERNMQERISENATQT